MRLGDLPGISADGSPHTFTHLSLLVHYLILTLNLSISSVLIGIFDLFCSPKYLIKSMFLNGDLNHQQIPTNAKFQIRLQRTASIYVARSKYDFISLS
jgi:hypothetical protein